MAGENELTVTGWGGSDGAADEPHANILNRMLTRRYAIDAEPSVTNTTAAVFAAVATLPAGELLDEDRAQFSGFVHVPTKNAAETLKIELELSDGTSEVVIGEVAAYNATADDTLQFSGRIRFKTIGAAAASAFAVYGESWIDGGAATRKTTSFAGDSTLDLTAELTLQARATWSAAHADNTAVLYDLALELFRSRKAS